MGHPDEEEWRQEAAMEDFLSEQFESRSREPVIGYLARYGDAVQERVDRCASESAALLASGFPGAALVRSAAGLEIAIRFFLIRPLLLSAFRSDEWASVLLGRVINARTTEDREMLPAILRNWDVDVTTIRLSDGTPWWETIVTRVWDRRNAYVHAGELISDEDARLAIGCLSVLMTDIIEHVATKLGFTRTQTGYWSVVLSSGDRDLNPPTTHATESPFDRQVKQPRALRNTHTNARREGGPNG